MRLRVHRSLHSGLLTLLVLATPALAATTACASPQPAGGAVPWSDAEALQAADLAATLGGSAPKPAIVYVGFRALYHPGHIPDASFHGPAAQPEGWADLKRWAETQPKDQPLVLYCGCCPFDHCPNVVPAYRLLRELGFTRIKVLILPTNFETDWVQQGYPIER